MKTKFKEHDIVIVDNKFATIIHVYPGNKAYVVEINNFGETEIKSVTEDELILVTKK